jgi:hypothetical protein
MTFKQRIPPAEIHAWAARYGKDFDDRDAERIGAAARSAHQLSRDQFLSLAEWKTKRSKSHCRKNSEEYVRQVTRSALTADEPRFKIEALRLLDGVDWATASVILHCCDDADWPIIDFRAFWSLRKPAPTQCSYSIWQAYTAYTRGLARDLKVSMRTLDRALWAYSKAKQSAARV